ncbi:MAG: alpha-hydroxy-acid oxidizing protein [Bacteroidetes bacterium]|nr:alpha-hydroxy-acid oxidizing protein [Bacteroidota bacterium]
MKRIDFLQKALLAAGGLTAGALSSARAGNPEVIPNPLPPADPEALNIFELEQVAKEKLPTIAYDYYRSGAWDEVTLKSNRESYEKLKIHYRVLVDVADRDLSTTVFGQKISFPIMVAPTAFHKLAHPDGELATARAAVNTGTIMTLSSLSTTTIEEVAAATNKNFWFQLYINKNREYTRDLVARAESAGAKALVVTVDTPMWGRRERDVRNGFHLPPGLSAINLVKYDKDAVAKGQTGAGLGQSFAWMLDATLQWKDMDWLAGITKLPIIIKGVCRADDARIALQHGVKGIVVSNHGGRQMDSAPATIDVLPSIVDAVGNDLTVLMDGGIRRGLDAMKAIAQGAKAVLVGRPVLWGLAAGGQVGVEKALTILRTELDLAMALSGCRNVREINRNLLG